MDSKNAGSSYYGASGLYHGIYENFSLGQDEQVKMFGQDEILTEMGWLDMQNCSVFLHPKSFALLPGLLYISFAKCVIKEIISNPFDMPKLDSVSFYKCELPLINKEVFAKLSGIEIDSKPDTTLNSVISNETFKDNIKLTSITLRHLKFETLTKELLCGVNSLQNLQLTNCGITKIDINSFEDLINLEFLLLSDNKIDSLPVGVFRPLKNLKYLGLYNNLMESINLQVFTDLIQLESILFPTKCLSTIDLRKLKQAVPNLKKIQLPDEDEESQEVQNVIKNLEDIADLEYEYVGVGCSTSEENMSEVQICC